ncbi:hypothetical protein QUF64_03215 [Anaerolineales bacterium HSG6]|nr:hypothetical protein [Anaerolineales bacterium HSG6]MDM8531086.1 hypothetical protein [Anaerolineales bacterium HSG25]
MPTIAEAKEAADQGAIQQSRLMFETIIQENPRDEEAWLGLADVLTEAEDKRVCYNNVLKINKKSRIAKEGLRSLDPQMDPLRAAFDIEAPEPEPLEEDDSPEWLEEMSEDEAVADEPAKRKKKKKALSKTGRSAQTDTPTPVLVAFGLALSVVVFAIGSGAAYFLLSSLNPG